jgi:hypothetical protein
MIVLTFPALLTRSQPVLPIVEQIAIQRSKPSLTYINHSTFIGQRQLIEVRMGCGTK